ncbi:hypothetical protein H4R34_004611 [Dimargaris verticillata]|uniref:HBS1-like protein N-terminal domain-containing protein n=1 Tax=Dimargaris verticillata TaxID=2761393 RepID=A0A9W8B575_9FUNG|nr:hypothetical protein H4R34_004611 [Dimargaris verticillata]
MSRHRNVRNLDLDEVLEEDQYEDEYADEEMTEEDFARLQETLQQVLDVVGDNIPVTDTEIRNMLWETYYDTQATTNWVLETSAQRKKEQAQSKSTPPTSDDNHPLLDPLTQPPIHCKANQLSSPPPPSSLAIQPPRLTTALSARPSQPIPTPTSTLTSRPKPTALSALEFPNRSKTSLSSRPSALSSGPSVIASALSALKSTPHQRSATQTPVKLPIRSTFSAQAHGSPSSISGLSLAGLAKHTTAQSAARRPTPLPRPALSATGPSRFAPSPEPPQSSIAAVESTLVSDPSKFAQFVLRPVEADYSSLAAGELRFDTAYALLNSHNQPGALNLPDPLRTMAHSFLPWLDTAWSQSNAQHKRPIRPFQFDTPSRDDIVDQAQQRSKWNAD